MTFVADTRALGGDSARFEFHTELARVAPYHLTNTADGAAFRQKQNELIRNRRGVLYFDVRAGLGNIGQFTAVQVVRSERHPSRAAQRTAPYFAPVYVHRPRAVELGIAARRSRLINVDRPTAWIITGGHYQFIKGNMSCPPCVMMCADNR